MVASRSPHASVAMDPPWPPSAAVTGSALRRRHGANQTSSQRLEREPVKPTEPRFAKPEEEPRLVEGRLSEVDQLDQFGLARLEFLD